MGKAGSNPSTFVPWWIDGRKQCHLGEKGKGKTKELWEDIYAAWIRYRLREPIQDGQVHPEDMKAMRQAWGHDLQILSATTQIE